MSDQLHKICLHCNAVMPAEVDPLDLLGGHHGECVNCRKWKRAHYAKVEAIILQESRTHAANNPKSTP
jgi:hypothetical protein